MYRASGEALLETDRQDNYRTCDVCEFACLIEFNVEITVKRSYMKRSQRRFHPNYTLEIKTRKPKTININAYKFEFAP